MLAHNWNSAKTGRRQLQALVGQRRGLSALVEIRRLNRSAAVERLGATQYLKRESAVPVSCLQRLSSEVEAERTEDVGQLHQGRADLSSCEPSGDPPNGPIFVGGLHRAELKLLEGVQRQFHVCNPGDDQITGGEQVTSVVQCKISFDRKC